MKTIFLKIFNTLNATALTLLGFSSCNNDGDFPCLYGTPTSDYVFKGNVTSKDGSPIKNIKVTAVAEYSGEQVELESTITDAYGNFQSNKLLRMTTLDTNELKIYFKDID